MRVREGTGRAKGRSKKVVGVIRGQMQGGGQWEKGDRKKGGMRSVRGGWGGRKKAMGGNRVAGNNDKE